MSTLVTNLWMQLEQLLTSSAPSDGWVYEVKNWVIQYVTEPILELLYVTKLCKVMPLSAITSIDLLP